MPTDDPAGPVVVGRVARPHGLAGEVVVDPLTDFPERFRAGLELLLVDPSGATRETRVTAVRWHQGRPLLKLSGVESLEAAEPLRGQDLAVPADRLAERPDGFVFHFEIEGCDAVGIDGRSLGRVEALGDVAGRPMLTLSTPSGPRDVPFVEGIVVSVDLGARRVVLDPPLGLLD